MSFDHLKSTVHKFNAIKSTVVTVATDLLYKYAMSIKKRTRLNTNGFFLLQMQCRHLTMQAPFHSANFL